MIKHISGDALKTNFDFLIHQVNCKGVMRSGIAKQIRAQYPLVYREYRNIFLSLDENDANGGDIFLSKVQVVDIGNGKYICNLFGQKDYGRDSNIVYTSYSAFQNALNTLKDIAIEKKIKSFTFPKRIGCGLANGDWNIVYKMIENMHNDINESMEFDVNIVDYSE